MTHEKIDDSFARHLSVSKQLVPLPDRMWFFIAAGVVGLASILPQTRNKVKDVPWMPIAITVGLGVLSQSLNNAIKSIGTESMATFEERYDLEVLQDPSVKPSVVWGHIGDQVVRRNLKGVTLVKRKRRINESDALQKQDAEENVIEHK